MPIRIGVKRKTETLEQKIARYRYMVGGGSRLKKATVKRYRLSLKRALTQKAERDRRARIRASLKSK